MVRHPLIRVIKRVERERSRLEGVEDTASESQAHENSRDLAATWREWVIEFRQERLAEYQAISQRLGWRLGGADDPGHRS
jgi:hypothetical protein